MKALAVILVLCLAGAVPARAALSPAQLADVEVDAEPNAFLPLSLPFINENGAARTLGAAIGGTPAVLVFADYTCTNLCGPILAFAADGLEKTGLVPSKDFHLVVVGLDPNDRQQEARAMKASRIGVHTPLGDATEMLIGNAEAIRVATDSAGYHYVYDAAHGQFAHPAAAFVVTKDGRITRVLSGLGLSRGDLRLALVDAGRGRVGSLLDQVTLRCFGFDAASGIYTATIARVMVAACAATAIVLAGGIIFLALGRRGRAPL